VRRTPRLDALAHFDAKGRLRAAAQAIDPTLMARAVRYLMTRETRSSFAIEREIPSLTREERFVRALLEVSDLDPTDPRSLAALQGRIVDPRFAEAGWRTEQNYVGRTVAGYRDIVDYPCPRPDDVADLMAGWAACYDRLLDDRFDPVTAAAVLSFGFVFIHPFLDANGRMHRFLLHHVLARRAVTPPGLIVPISSAILRDRAGYEAALARISTAIAPYVDADFDPERRLRVRNDTAYLYRTLDVTHLVEYLLERLRDAIDVDLVDEISFLERFDRALEALRAVVDLPDRRARELVTLLWQNHGRLAARKRDRFPELRDDEIADIEAAVADANR
jgi:Fic family protein